MANYKKEVTLMLAQSEYRRCCELIKTKYFAGLIDEESILILSPNGKEYCACIFDVKPDSELYLYRLLNLEEYDKIKPLQLAENWFIEANEKHTEYALIYEKFYSSGLPSVDEIATDTLYAINYIIKEIET